MAAQAGWYPDPGGGQGLFRYWDGKAWSAATSPNPAAPPPAQGLASPPSGGQPGGTPFGGSSGGQPYGGQAYGGQAYGGQAYGATGGQPGAQPPYGGAAYGQQPGSAYANYQQQTGKKKSAVGWWIAGAAVLIVIIVVSVIAIRAVTGGTDIGTVPGGTPSQDTCPAEPTEPPEPPEARPADGRVHGGPVSYPQLGAPWGAPEGDTRVPFGSDVQSQSVVTQANYQPGKTWVASVLVGELQAGDGFFTPEQGSQIVVKCILGRFYDNNPVNSNVKVNEKATIDGHEAWIVESQLTFDIEGLDTKGELLIVAIISAGTRSGLYYASIPDSNPELVQPARDALEQLQVQE